MESQAQSTKSGAVYDLTVKLVSGKTQINVQECTVIKINQLKIRNYKKIVNCKV